MHRLEAIKSVQTVISYYWSLVRPIKWGPWINTERKF